MMDGDDVAAADDDDDDDNDAAADDDEESQANQDSFSLLCPSMVYQGSWLGIAEVWRWEPVGSWLVIAGFMVES